MLNALNISCCLCLARRGDQMTAEKQIILKITVLPCQLVVARNAKQIVKTLKFQYCWYDKGAGIRWFFSFLFFFFFFLQENIDTVNMAKQD